MAAQDVIDQILEAKQIRLTCRAKQLLSLILDGLLNEPFHAVDFHLTPEEEFHKRLAFFDNRVREMPSILEDIAERQGPQHRDRVDGFRLLTLFDLLHNFELSTLFPGKI